MHRLTQILDSLEKDLWKVWEVIRVLFEFVVLLGFFLGIVYGFALIDMISR